VVEIEASGHVVLPGLLREFMSAATGMGNKDASRKTSNLALLFPVEIQTAIQHSADEYNKIRLVIDFISGLTDRHALSLYRKIMGISL
jgi:dGTPase